MVTVSGTQLLLSKLVLLYAMWQVFKPAAHLWAAGPIETAAIPGLDLTPALTHATLGGPLLGSGAPPRQQT
ncbi:MAG: hypothetical protein FRX49_10119 [Trebouxia sp. A1-2]|nr:MAG: hypothetical protein FRX49_10119 [Trebouxia sp. A1-2]